MQRTLAALSVLIVVAAWALSSRWSPGAEPGAAPGLEAGAPRDLSALPKTPLEVPPGGHVNTARRAAMPTGASTANPAPSTVPSVILITIDTLRPDYLGFHGFDRSTAPFLARLAEGGTVFDRAFSTSSWTAPATASLFTGCYPNRHGVIEGFMAHRTREDEHQDSEPPLLPLKRLARDIPTLAEVLRRAGLRTFGIAANINIGEVLGFDRGFDRFHLDPVATAADIHKVLREWRDELTRSEPYFLYLHFNDVHSPYHVRHPYHERQLDELGEKRARYLSEIGFADHHIGRILRDLCYERDKLVVVVSDHGEEFRDHGRMGHLATLYSELNQVLLMFHGPDLGVRPQRVAANVGLIDVLPTIADLVGADLAGADFSGTGLSLAPLLRRDAAAALHHLLEERVLFAHRIGWAQSDKQVWAAIRGAWKLIDYSQAEPELFDHATDPAEQRNLLTTQPAGSWPEIAAFLNEALSRHRQAGTARDRERIEVELDEDLLRTLHSLGYVK